MLRKIRMVLALLCFVAITLLFLDFTGTVHPYLAWLADIQFLPALLAANFFVVAVLTGITLLFGRVYCSVICPLGILQDIFARIGHKYFGKHYFYSPAKNLLRYGFLFVFVLAFVAGLGFIVSLLAPYSAFGRIVQSLFSPLWIWGNNFLAYIAERVDSYSFYSAPFWLRSLPTFFVAVVTFVVIGFLVWRGGRTYCNTVCPVGSVLGLLSRFSLFKPVIDVSKCNGCGLCVRNCKASCIDNKNKTIDYSRCVACMDCIDTCRKNAITYTYRKMEPKKDKITENGFSRRAFIAVSTLFAADRTIASQEKKLEGGLAVLEDKKIPERKTRIVPPGACSIRNVANHCTACQLCVAVCPNEVLRPSGNLTTFMQPEVSYERGYCRPECTKCSEVCPTGAIRPITRADKSAIQVGHAVVIRENCVSLNDGVSCGNCERHCPTGAITMVASDSQKKSSPKVPVVNIEKCIGCGACENLCPARPLSAIYVEGHITHKDI